MKEGGSEGKDGRGGREREREKEIKGRRGKESNGEGENRRNGERVKIKTTEKEIMFSFLYSSCIHNAAFTATESKL